MAFGDVVQSNSGTSTTATTAPTLGSATTAGNLIVLTFAADDYNGTPNSGWTQSSEMEQQTFHGGYIWWLTATASMTIPSYTIGSATRSAWTLVEYAGPFNASPYDTSQGVFQQTSADNITSDAMTPTAGSRLMVGGLNAQHATSDQVAWDNLTGSFTEAVGSLFNGGNPRLTISQLRRIVTADGSTSYTVGGRANGGSQSRSALIISFKASAGGGSTYNHTTAETTTAADTPAGLLVTTKAVAETAAAAETAGGLLVTAKAVAEAASAAETVAGLLAFTGAVAEVAAAAEATDASVVPAGAIDVSVAEATSAVDTVAGLVAFIGAVAESASANDNVDATGGTLVLPEVPTQVPGAGPPGPDGTDRRRFEIFLLEEEDEEDEKPRRKRRLRLKKAEIEEKVEAAVEYIEAGSPRPMSPKAMASQVSTLMGLDALLEVDRRRVERTIYQYLAAMLEEEEEESMAMMLLAA